MTEINTDLMQRYGLENNQANKASGNELLQEDFLTLMTEQLKNQDPMKPTDNGEFLGQMAQFSSVSSLGKLEQTVSQLATSLQAGMGLNAVNMIGKEALVASDRVTLENDGDSARGAVNLPAGTGNLRVTISDPGGNVIRQIDMGNQPAGLREFTWDGKRNDGSAAAKGNYLVTAQFDTEGDTTEAAQTLLFSKIDSVSFDKGQPKLNIQNGQAMEFAAIQRIQ
jgi:flagellar basal-body rod modification protein FlgD